MTLRHSCAPPCLVPLVSLAASWQTSQLTLLAIVMPQTSMNFMGYVKQYGPWTSMADLYQTRQIPAYLEAVFGQNVQGSGLDYHWRLNTAGLPTREIYAYWILLGTTEP